MWPAIAAIASAGIGAWGQSDANRANRDMAREQMRFQERMSNNAQSFSERMASTQAQRSVDDYRKAGLNPALAYERAAAAPAGVTAGGASSRNENVMRDIPNVVNSALQTKALAQQMAIAQLQSDADLGVKDSQRRKNIEEAAATIVNAKMTNLNWSTQAGLQPHTIRRQVLENQLMQYGIPEARNRAAMETTLENLGGSPTAKLFLEFMRGISGARQR